MAARVGEKYRFEYPNEPQFNTTVTVIRVDGAEPDDLIHFDDHTHTKQKHLDVKMKVEG